MTKRVLGTKKEHITYKNIALRLIIIAFLLIFSFLFSMPSLVYGEDFEISKTSIRKAFLNLPISSDQREYFVDCFFKGGSQKLLVFRGTVGFNSLLKTLESRNLPSNEIISLLNIFCGVVNRNLPIYMITSTSIRLLRKGATIQLLKSRIREEIYTLSEMSSFVQRQDLGLSNKNLSSLVNVLAETVELFIGKVMASSEVNFSDLGQLQKTLDKTIKYSNLPVSFDSGGLLKSSNGGDSHTGLVGFLRNPNTLDYLIELAREINNRRE